MYAMCLALLCVATLAGCIAHVVGLRTEKQVIRLDTRRVVATVQNIKVRPGSILQEPRNDVCSPGPALDRECSITIAIA